MTSKTSIRRAAEATRDHARKTFDHLHAPPDFGVVRAVDPLQVELVGSSLVLDAEQMVVTQSVREYDFRYGIRVDDAVKVTLMPSGDWLVEEVVSDFDEFPEFGGSGVVGLPAGGSTHQALLKRSAVAFDADWFTIHEVPAGGEAGDVLTKASGVDYALVWQAASDAAAGLAFDTYPQAGDWLYAETTNALGAPHGYGIEFRTADDFGVFPDGGINMDAAHGNVRIEADEGLVSINADTQDVSVYAWRYAEIFGHSAVAMDSDGGIGINAPIVNVGAGAIIYDRSGGESVDVTAGSVTVGYGVTEIYGQETATSGPFDERVSIFLLSQAGVGGGGILLQSEDANGVMLRVRDPGHGPIDLIDEVGGGIFMETKLHGGYLLRSRGGGGIYLTEYDGGGLGLEANGSGGLFIDNLGGTFGQPLSISSNVWNAGDDHVIEIGIGAAGKKVAFVDHFGGAILVLDEDGTLHMKAGADIVDDLP